MKALKWLIASVVIVASLSAIVWASPPRSASWQQANGGFARTTPLFWHTGDSLAVGNTDAYVDSTTLAATQSDTSLPFAVAGLRGMSALFRVRAHNDSLHATFTLQVSPDTSLTSSYWVSVSPTYSILEASASAGDESVGQKVYFASAGDTTNASGGMAALSANRWARIIVTGGVASGDTITVQPSYLTRIFDANPSALQSRNPYY